MSKAPRFKFRLLVGQHNAKDFTATPTMVVNKDTGKEEPAYPTRVYDAKDPNNNVVETDIDLVARFGSEKFRLVAETPAATRDEILARKAELDRQLQELEAKEASSVTTPSAKPSFDSMTRAQLESYAHENEIDISQARTKDEILAILKSVD